MIARRRGTPATRRSRMFLCCCTADGPAGLGASYDGRWAWTARTPQTMLPGGLVRRRSPRRRGRYGPRVFRLPRGCYRRERYLFWRVRILLWLAVAGAGWVVSGAAGLVGGVVVAVAAEGMWSYRRSYARRAAPVAEPDVIAAARAEARRIARRWETEAAPSPAGWQPPAGARPAWGWTPPGGIEPRLDRVPAWVRLWYRTPFVDRYAHAWMWEHGGWDVLPPTAKES